MELHDRAVLRIARARWYEDMALVVRAGVSMAFAPPEEVDAHGEK